MTNSISVRFNRIILYVAALLSACSGPLRVSHYDNQQYTFSAAQNVTVDSIIYRQIRPYHDSLTASMSRILGRTTGPLLKTELANFVADACFQQLKQKDQHPFDFMVFNRGGLRRTLPQGNITESDIYELMPFDNTLVIAQLDGTTTMELCQWISRRGTDPVAGITMNYTEGTGAWNILIGGEPIDPNRTYWVATNSYVVNGGDHFDMFVKRKAFYDSKLLVRDALINYLLENESGGVMIEPDYVQRTRK